jgi:tetraacyldisaccharide-1-P 4'-kinase
VADYRLLKGRKVLAFSGLGDNNSFFDLLRDIERTWYGRLRFPTTPLWPRGPEEHRFR